MNKDCELIRPLITPYVDGRLESGDKRAVEAHAAACEGCRHELRWAKALKTAAKAQPRAAMPAAFKAQLKAEIRRRVAASERPQGSSWLDFWESARLSWRLSLAGLSTAAALAAAAFVLDRHAASLEEIPLDDLLDAHRRYALTMPAADKDRIYASLAEEGSDDL